MNDPWDINPKYWKIFRQKIRSLGIILRHEEIESSPFADIEPEQKHIIAVLQDLPVEPPKVTQKSFRHFRLTLEKGSEEVSIIISTPCCWFQRTINRKNPKDFFATLSPNATLVFIDTLCQADQALYLLTLQIVAGYGVLDKLMNNQLVEWMEERGKECFDHFNSDEVEQRFKYERDCVLKLVDVFGVEELEELIDLIRSGYIK
jgi:hypothetical protein